MNNHIFVETPLGKVWVLESEGAIVGLKYGDEEALRTFEIKHSLQESLNKQTPLLKKAKQMSACNCHDLALLPIFQGIDYILVYSNCFGIVDVNS